MRQDAMYLIHKPGGVDVYLTRMFLLSSGYADDQPVEMIDGGESFQTTIDEIRMHGRAEETEHAIDSSPVGSR